MSTESYLYPSQKDLYESFTHLIKRFLNTFPPLSHQTRANLLDGFKDRYRYYKGDIVTYTKKKVKYECEVISYNPYLVDIIGESKIILKHPIEGIINAFPFEVSPPTHGSKDHRELLHILPDSPKLFIYKLMDDYILHYPSFPKDSAIPFKHLHSHTDYPFYSPLEVKHIIPLNDFINGHGRYPYEPESSDSILKSNKKRDSLSQALFDLDLFNNNGTISRDLFYLRINGLDKIIKDYQKDSTLENVSLSSANSLEDSVNESQKETLTNDLKEISSLNLFSKALSSNGFLYIGYSLVYSPHSLSPRLVHFAYVETFSPFGTPLKRTCIELNEGEYNLCLRL